MRALALHEDVIVVVSGIWQTTCTAIRAGEEGFLIDSPVLPDELDALPSLLQQAGFPVSGLLCTHGDWDHLLARTVFGDVSLGCGAATAARLQTEPGAAQRSLRGFDEEHYVEGRRPLRLGGVQALPVPGRLSLGEGSELELHQATGHTADGVAFFVPWRDVLVCGDFLSPVEIPMISPGGSAREYLGTLARLRPLVERAATVVPGHGEPQPGADALTILDEDVAYLEQLLSGGDAPLPPKRASATQKKIHGENRLTLEG